MSNHRHAALMMLALLLLVSACGPPLLETSSREDLQESLFEMKEELDLAATGQLESAIDYLTEGAKFGEDESKWDAVLTAYASLQGMSARQIIVTAWDQKVQSYGKEIEELEALLAEHQRSQELLTGVTIDRFRLFKPSPGFLDRPVIELKATNRTSRKITEVQFRASLINPGEPELIVDERIDQPVYRSFARNQQIKLRIEVQDALWKTMLASCKECTFHFEVAALRGPGNASIASTDFGTFEKSRLAKLQSRLQALQASGPPLGTLADN
jgi:hypothetical protein